MDKQKENELDFIPYSFSVGERKSLAHTDADTRDRILRIQQFAKKHLLGSYFSCMYRGRLRIHIVFNEDTSEYNDELVYLMKETLELTSIKEGKLWIGNQNNKIVERLTEEFDLRIDSEPFLYESHEMAMTREKFDGRHANTTLEIRSYQEEYLDAYLSLLHRAMSFKIPPFDYMMKKEEYRKELRERNKEGMFEAFWKENELVGLYWICGTEIDHIAVEERYQHQGYAQQILTRAMEIVFRNPDVDSAWLLVVEWNSKAFTFYRNFGMQERNVYHVPYCDTL